jgi:hypothetical protein
MVVILAGERKRRRGGRRGEAGSKRLHVQHPLPERWGDDHSDDFCDDSSDDFGDDHSFVFEVRHSNCQQG